MASALAPVDQTKPVVAEVPPAPDYDALADRFATILNDAISAPDFPRGNALYAIVLRRLFDHPRTGFVTAQEHVHTLNSHTIVDRLNRDDALRRAADARNETARVYRDSGSDILAALRSWVNERNLPSKYRLEGARAVITHLERMMGQLPTSAPTGRD